MTSNKTTGCISIFALDHEIDYLRSTLIALKITALHVEECDMILAVTILVDDMEEYDHILLEAESLKTYCDWVHTLEFSVEAITDNPVIQGCVSRRRESLRKYNDVDFHIWLDTDLVFNPHTLFYMIHSYLIVSQRTSHFVITPEIVRIWDNTWDVIVNEQYKGCPINYHKTADPYKVVMKHEGVPEVEELSVFKFAGGWFTLISTPLLNEVGIPESFGHYGLEDTFICHASEIYNMRKTNNACQYVIRNVIVAEDYRYRKSNHLLDPSMDKEAMLKIAHTNFPIELQKYATKLLTETVS